MNQQQPQQLEGAPQVNINLAATGVQNGFTMLPFNPVPYWNINPTFPGWNPMFVYGQPPIVGLLPASQYYLPQYTATQLYNYNYNMNLLSQPVFPPVLPYGFAHNIVPQETTHVGGDLQADTVVSTRRESPQDELVAGLNEEAGKVGQVHECASAELVPPEEVLAEPTEEIIDLNTIDQLFLTRDETGFIQSIATVIGQGIEDRRKEANGGSKEKSLMLNAIDRQISAGGTMEEFWRLIANTVADADYNVPPEEVIETARASKERMRKYFEELFQQLYSSGNENVDLWPTDLTSNKDGQCKEVSLPFQLLARDMHKNVDKNEDSSTTSTDPNFDYYTRPGENGTLKMIIGKKRSQQSIDASEEMTQVPGSYRREWAIIENKAQKEASDGAKPPIILTFKCSKRKLVSVEDVKKENIVHQDPIPTNPVTPSKFKKPKRERYEVDHTYKTSHFSRSAHSTRILRSQQ